MEKDQKFQINVEKFEARVDKPNVPKKKKPFSDSIIPLKEPLLHQKRFLAASRFVPATKRKTSRRKLVPWLIANPVLILGLGFGLVGVYSLENGSSRFRYVEMPVVTQGMFQERRSYWDHAISLKATARGSARAVFLGYGSSGLVGEGHQRIKVPSS